MFDIARYHNDGSRSEMNCKEHFDPGLLSISLKSSEPGLQLKDEFGRWTKVPENDAFAVIWVTSIACDLTKLVLLRQVMLQQRLIQRLNMVFIELSTLQRRQERQD
jgi:hypothetical protein